VTSRGRFTAIASGPLRFGTSLDDEAECQNVLGACMARPGLFFSPGCALAGDTKQENIRVPMDCADRYGSYAERDPHAA
jgi:hypothetical protein